MCQSERFQKMFLGPVESLIFFQKVKVCGLRNQRQKGRNYIIAESHTYRGLQLS